MTRQLANKKSSDVNARELEQRLRESIERFELVFKATNDVVYDLDIGKAKVEWNEALYTQYGYKRSEPAGTIEWWTRAIHPEDALRVEAAVSGLLESDQNTWQLEYRFRKADGTYAYVRDRAFVLRGPGGVPLRIIGSFLDITQAVQLDRAKDEFISLVSHQLRTPLSIIRFHGELLLGGALGKLNGAQREHAQYITDASVRLIKLVGDILNISRVTLDRMKLDLKPTEVNRLIALHIDELLPMAAEKGVTVTFRPDDTLGLVLLDKTVFGQILHNFLTNAIRYTKPGQGRVEVGFVRDKNGFTLTVSDNGIGIPRAARAHVFSRFYRATNAANMEEHGTGLGLYLVKLMADAFGGKVWFESAKGSGTTFYVRISSEGMKPKRTP